MIKVLLTSVAFAVLFSLSAVVILADEESGSNGYISPFSPYCTKDVEYTEWSPCDPRFGKTGYQYREIVMPTYNGCIPTVAQRVAQQRDCLK